MDGAQAATEARPAGDVAAEQVCVETAEVVHATQPAPEAVASTAGAEAAAAPAGATVVLRRGLPRTTGGAAWPIEAEVTSRFAPVVAQFVAPPQTEPAPASPSSVAAPSAASPIAEAPAAPARDVASARPAAPAAVPPADVAVRNPRAPLSRRALTALGALAVVIVAASAILIARWLVELDWVAGFIEQYPGESHLPENAPVGFPAWLGWQHAFNAFLMVLIIRSGLRVRSEGRPSHYWTPRWNPARKISLWKWFHQSLDLLWMLNGAAFIVLLLVTGQWMRVVPTSWDVIPNALSAGLQYLSLDWPTDNGWVNYNGLQLLAYFTTIFIAAPLAALSGFRMSGLWSEKAKRLSRIVPLGFARAVHFPVMLYFVAFIVIHVCLVFSTGALRNLNHMFAMQGSADPTIFEGNWTGFWIFAALVVAIVAAWFAARPLVLGSIARVFGRVSDR